jgi:hypothetical protein
MKSTEPKKSMLDALDWSLHRETPQILKSLPWRYYSFNEEERNEKIKSRADAIFENKWLALKERYAKSGDEPNECQYRNLREEANKEACDDDSAFRMYVVLWDQSERTLALLRSRGQHSPTSEASRNKALARFQRHLDFQRFPEANPESLFCLGPNRKRRFDFNHPKKPVSLNLYFEETRPELVLDFGFAFHSTIPHERDRFLMPREDPGTVRLPEEKIIGINTLFWAAFLGGDHRLFHDVIFFEPEQQFYFYDLVADCYLPTSEQKLRLWLSHTLEGLAWGQLPEVATMILKEFRSKIVFDEILARAKALLAADPTFFSGPGAESRFHQNQLVPSPRMHENAISAFIAAQIEVANDEVLPVTECMKLAERWYRLNEIQSPPPQELKSYLEQAILKIHNRSVRNDLKSADGTHVRSWKGLRLCVPHQISSDSEQNTASDPMSELLRTSGVLPADTITKPEAGKIPEAAVTSLPELAPSSLLAEQSQELALAG